MSWADVGSAMKGCITDIWKSIVRLGTTVFNIIPIGSATPIVLLNIMMTLYLICLNCAIGTGIGKVIACPSLISITAPTLRAFQLCSCQTNIYDVGSIYLSGLYNRLQLHLLRPNQYIKSTQMQLNKITVWSMTLLPQQTLTGSLVLYIAWIPNM